MRCAARIANRTLFNNTLRFYSSADLPQPLYDAIRFVRALAPARFDETVELSLNLNIDVKKPAHAVRGVAPLPHGTGKPIRIAVFAKGEKAALAKEAGADIVGDQDLVAMIQEGKIDFDRCIATPDMMGMVGKVARILGPRGLMPNPKVGTVTVDVQAAVKAAKQGQVEFKAEKAGIVHGRVGKLSFTDVQLAENIESFVKKVIEIKPASIKGIYINSAYLSSTQGRGGVPIDVSLPPFKVVRSETQQVAQTLQQQLQRRLDTLRTQLLQKNLPNHVSLKQ